MGTNILELRKITKQFPGALAVKDVDFELRAGEVHALVGENGAGKSTLVKMMTGVIKPTRGDIFYQGEKVVWHNAQESIQQESLKTGVSHLDLTAKLKFRTPDFHGRGQGVRRCVNLRK